MTTTINASTSSGLVNTADTSGILQLQTANTAAVTIDASQNVTIPNTTTLGSSTAKVTINRVSDATGYGAVSFNGDLSSAGIAGFYGRTGGSDTNAIYMNGSKLFLQAAGTTVSTVNANGIGLGTAIPSSGIGLSFPATQSASSDANTLDDYEEGTFTPYVSIGGSTSGITYSVQVGGYVKVGGVCHVFGYVQLTSKNALTGAVVFQGLPFATKSTANLYPAPAIGAYGGLTGITAYGMGVDVPPGATGGTFLYGTGTACAGLQGANIANSFNWEFTFSFPTA